MIKHQPTAKEVAMLHDLMRLHGYYEFLDVKDAELDALCRRILARYGIYDRRTHVAVPVNRRAKLLSVLKHAKRAVKTVASAFCVPKIPHPVGYRQSAICQLLKLMGLSVTRCYKKRYRLSACNNLHISNM